MNILDSWNRLSKLPGGKTLFSKSIRFLAPYSASISPEVLELRPGFCKIQIKERRRLQNPFRSVHAAALFNLGELVSGLGFLATLPKDMRGIPVGLSIEYFKKARGILTATSTSVAPTEKVEQEVTLTAEIHNEAGELVSKLTAHWKVSPRE